MLQPADVSSAFTALCGRLDEDNNTQTRVCVVFQAASKLFSLLAFWNNRQPSDRVHLFLLIQIFGSCCHHEAPSCMSHCSLNPRLKQLLKAGPHPTLHRVDNKVELTFFLCLSHRRALEGVWGRSVSNLQGNIQFFFNSALYTWLFLKNKTKQKKATIHSIVLLWNPP